MHHTLRKWGLVVLICAASGICTGGLMPVSSNSNTLSANTSNILTPNPCKMVGRDYQTSGGYVFEFVNGSRQISDGSDFAAVRDGFEKWTGLPGSALSFQEKSSGPAGGGNRGFTPGVRDGRNEISWVGYDQNGKNLWSDVLGMAADVVATVKTWYMPGSDTVIEQDLYFNDAYADWYTGSDGAERGGRFFVEQVALHEIGHLFGLKDVYNPGQDGYQRWMGRGNEGVVMYGYTFATNENIALSVFDMEAAYLAHPVPEPASVMMFLLLGAGIISRRRM